MSVKYHCDRCNACVDQLDENCGWLEVDFPVPYGHPSRVDCYRVQRMHLCKLCHLALRDWWLTRNIPVEIGGSR